MKREPETTNHVASRYPTSAINLAVDVLPPLMIGTAMFHEPPWERSIFALYLPPSGLASVLSSTAGFPDMAGIDAVTRTLASVTALPPLSVTTISMLFAPTTGGPLSILIATK